MAVHTSVTPLRSTVKTPIEYDEYGATASPELQRLLDSMIKAALVSKPQHGVEFFADYLEAELCRRTQAKLNPFGLYINTSVDLCPAPGRSRCLSSRNEKHIVVSNLSRYQCDKNCPFYGVKEDPEKDDGDDHSQASYVRVDSAGKCPERITTTPQQHRVNTHCQEVLAKGMPRHFRVRRKQQKIVHNTQPVDYNVTSATSLRHHTSDYRSLEAVSKPPLPVKEVEESDSLKKLQMIEEANEAGLARIIFRDNRNCGVRKIAGEGGLSDGQGRRMSCRDYFFKHPGDMIRIRITLKGAPVETEEKATQMIDHNYVLKDIEIESDEEPDQASSYLRRDVSYAREGSRDQPDAYPHPDHSPGEAVDQASGYPSPDDRYPKDSNSPYPQTDTPFYGKGGEEMARDEGDVGDEEPAELPDE